MSRSALVVVVAAGEFGAEVEEVHPNEALEAGADGVLDKVETPERLFTTIRSLRGE